MVNLYVINNFEFDDYIINFILYKYQQLNIFFCKCIKEIKNKYCILYIYIYKYIFIIFVE